MPFSIMTLSREKFSHAQEVKHLTFWQREQQLVCNKLLTQNEQWLKETRDADKENEQNKLERQDSYCDN